MRHFARHLFLATAVAISVTAAAPAIGADPAAAVEAQPAAASYLLHVDGMT